MEKKKTGKKYLGLIFVAVFVIGILLLIFAMPTRFYGTQRDDGTYDLEISTVNRLSKKVTVPADYNGARVTSFLVDAYDRDETFDKVTTLILSEGIKEIDLKLLDCTPNLERLELPSTIEAVYGNISDKVEVVIASGAKVELKTGCFVNTATQTLTGSQDNAEIPDGVKVIGENAFYGAKLKSVKIPASVERFEDFALAGIECSAPFEIDLHEGVKYVGFNAFASKVTISKVTISTTAKLPESLFGTSKNGGAAIKSFVLNVQPNIVSNLNDTKPTASTFKVSGENNAEVLRYVYVKDGLNMVGSKGAFVEIRYKKLSESDLEGYSKYTTADLSDDTSAYTFISFQVTY